MGQKIMAFIQARMGSSRLPGKSLMPILGVPLIMQVIARVQHVRGLDEIVVVTSHDAADDVLVETLHAAGRKVFRGDLENVQKRFHDAALKFRPDVIMRITGDNPLIEPILLERMIQTWEQDKADYVACQTCILGVGAELFTRAAFERAIALSTNTYDREHVTPPFYQNESKFKVRRVPVEEHLADATITLTVDSTADFEKIVDLFERFYHDGYISNEEVVAYLRKEMNERYT
jgi:spore coat polysaccharide biosynthesis protein SpsF